MEFLNRVIPTCYIAALMIAIGVFAFCLSLGAEQALEIASLRLYQAYMALGVLFGSVYLLFTVVQLAVIDLHRDRYMRVNEERQRYTRLFCAWLAFLFAYGAAFYVHARVVSQRLMQEGFVHSGSMVYVLALLALVMAWVSWQAAQRNHGE